jgi:hypothetical protein
MGKLKKKTCLCYFRTLKKAVACSLEKPFRAFTGLQSVTFHNRIFFIFLYVAAQINLRIQSKSSQWISRFLHFEEKLKKSREWNSKSNRFTWFDFEWNFVSGFRVRLRPFPRSLVSHKWKYHQSSVLTVFLKQGSELVDKTDAKTEILPVGWRFQIWANCWNCYVINLWIATWNVYDNLRIYPIICQRLQ